MSDKTKTTLEFGKRRIILIGTAHVSRESIDEVKEAVRAEKPNQVCVELDEGRYKSMTQKENWEKLDMAKIFREGKGFLLIANLVLSGFQRRMGNELGVKPGDEMRAALEAADELKIPHALCDREIQVTLRRAWAKCGLWSKAKLLASLISSAFTTEKLSVEEIENLKETSELDGMMDELAAYLPRVKETLIDERDFFLAAKIWTAGLSDATPDAPLTQVAVVGAGHMKGLVAHLQKIAAGEESPDTASVNEVPPSGILYRAAGWLIPAALVALVAAGFLRMGAGTSLSMLLHWVLWNGSLAAAGALLALGHPLTILASFLGAPIGTLSPFISVGFISGLCEAILRKPRVKDAETLIDDISTLKGIYRNRITRALLVFVLSSMGGVAGNFISIPSLAKILAG